MSGADFNRGAGSGMMRGCLPQRRSPSVCWTHIDSPVCGPCHSSWACSAMRTHGWYGWCGAQKNGLWRLWPGLSGMVRPYYPTSARSALRGLSHLPRVRGAPGGLPRLRGCEARACGVSGRQRAVHQALCLLRGATLSQRHGQGHRRGAQARLAHGQGAGQAVHGGPVGARWRPRPQGDWHRRDLDPQAAHPIASWSAI
jgi:hypothetical protein